MSVNQDFLNTPFQAKLAIYDTHAGALSGSMGTGGAVEMSVFQTGKVFFYLRHGNLLFFSR